MLKRCTKNLLMILLAGALPGFWAMPAHAQTIVCLDTNVGEICMEMLEQEAPGTVANFLNYVERGDFDNTFVHRNEPNFVIQLGGYKIDPIGEEIHQDPPINNEFRVSNTRGTVAMARLPGQVNSATSEFFINLTNNSPNLDFVDGGFTVFARVVGVGMNVADTIGRMLRRDLSGNLGPVFTTVPVRRETNVVEVDDLVIVNRVYVAEEGREFPDPEPEEPEEPEIDEILMCTQEWLQDLRPPTVCMDTNTGNFCLDLLHDDAPNTVKNFLTYVTLGRYDNTLIHRSAPGFVIQGGGFRTSPLGANVRTFPPIQNEFSASNTTGSVAMAKIQGAPDSATSEWFVNLADNTFLDTENEGFTVFARVRDNGMEVINGIANLSILNLANQLDQALNSMPFRNEEADKLDVGDLVIVRRAYAPDLPPNPCQAILPPVFTEFTGNSFIAPVRLDDGKIYRLVFALTSSSPQYVFQVNESFILELNDVGQETASYSQADGILRIPSARAPSLGLTLKDIVFERSSNDRLEFRLRSATTVP